MPVKVQVLGVGCTRCSALYDEAEAAIAEAGVEAELEKVVDLEAIASFGVVTMPGLVIDGEVRSAGAIPKAKKIAKWLRSTRAR